MRKLILYFLMFLAAVRFLEKVNLPTLIVGIGLLLALVGAMHIAATPENYDY